MKLKQFLIEGNTIYCYCVLTNPAIVGSVRAKRNEDETLLDALKFTGCDILFNDMNKIEPFSLFGDSELVIKLAITKKSELAQLIKIVSINEGLYHFNAFKFSEFIFDKFIVTGKLTFNDINIKHLDLMIDKNEFILFAIYEQTISIRKELPPNSIIIGEVTFDEIFRNT